jgi:hypothetical protein
MKTNHTNHGPQSRRSIANGRWAAGALGGALALAATDPAQAALTRYDSEAAWLSAVTVTQRVGFDELPAGTTVSTAYPGMTFSSFNGGMPLTAAESFPHSPANVLAVDDPLLGGGGGGVRLTLDNGQQGLGFWYSDSQFAGNVVSVFDASNQKLGDFELIPGHPTEWQFIGFTSSAGDILRADIAMGSADRLTLDDFQIAAVPEPATWAMALGGGLALAALQRRRSARER